MKQFFAFNAGDNEGAELAIFDEIGFWGTSAKSFRDQLTAVRGKHLTVAINSPGGSVVDGFAIYNMLRAHKGGVTVKVMGLAASIASVVAMAGEKIVMPKNAMMMIHNPWAGVIGDAEEMRKTADVLDKLKDGIISAYVDQTGKRKETISRLMDDETWLSAEEALEQGFADEIGDEIKVQNQFRDYLPEKIANTFTANHGGSKPNQQENQPDMKPEEIQALQNRVSSLEAEKKQLEDSHAAALETAKNTARQEAETAEANRRTKIQEIANKYNKDGDLDGITVKALAGKTTPEEFKDQVLDAVNARPTRPALKPGDKAKDNPKTEDEAFEKFKADYAACEDSASRMALVRKHKAFAQRLAREGNE